MRKCLDSILSQTYQDFEIIAVDDCSRDGSVALLRSYQSTDKRIHLFQNEQNLGLVKNWNQCLKKANGAWIKYLFQDDFWEPECLSEVYSQSKNLDFIFHARTHIIDENVKPFLKSFYGAERVSDMPELRSKTDIPAEEINVLITKHSLFNFFGEPSCVAFRRAMVERFGYFNENLIQLCDYEYWCRIASNTGARYINKRLLTFAVHGNSATSSNLASKAFRFNYLDHLIIFREFLENPFYSSLRKTPANAKADFESLYTARFKRMVYFLMQQPVKSRIVLYEEINKYAPFLSEVIIKLRSMYYGYKLKGLLGRVSIWLKSR